MHILDGRNLTDNSVEGILGEAERLARGVHEAGESPERHAAWARADIPQCRSLQTLPMLTSLELLNLDIDTVANMKHNIQRTTLVCMSAKILIDGWFSNLRYNKPRNDENCKMCDGHYSLVQDFEVWFMNA